MRERIKDGLKIVGRVGAAAAITGLGYLGAVRPQEAHADINEPVRYIGQDGNVVSDAPLRSPGRAVLFYGPNGFADFCGNPYRGPIIAAVVANEAEMNIKVKAQGQEIYNDPIAVAGDDYRTRGEAMNDALRTKAADIAQRTGQSPRLISVIYIRDALGQAVCDKSMDTTETVVLQPQQPLTPEICPLGSLQITSLEGNLAANISGVPERVTGSFDLADHGIFRGVHRLGDLNNVLGEPGGMLVDRSLIPAAELPAWDARVAAGSAEYLRPGINFFNFDSPDAPGLTRVADGSLQFTKDLPKHVIVRIDAEEAQISLTSASGDRNVQFNPCQLGMQNDKGHQTVFIRTPYEQGMRLTLKNVTAPGTQVQIFGLQVKDPIAFASGEAFYQGVGSRQARPDYPRYMVYSLNVNDLTLAAAESSGPGEPFQTIRKNYN